MQDFVHQPNEPPKVGRKELVLGFPATLYLKGIAVKIFQLPGP